MILVVDDHAEVRTSVVRLLASYGYDAQAIAGGREALLFLQNNAPKLVILDLNMPDVDGLEVLRAMRMDARLLGLPVVMLTACLDHDGKGDAIMALGVQGWIVKVSHGWAERLVEAAERYAGNGRPAKRDLSV
jgi:CheY-like chemotaxis protein